MSKVQIICSRPGMARCGKAHPASAFYNDGDWTPEQLAAFKADPAFTVREGIDEAAENVLTETDFQLAVKAEVDLQVADIKSGLQVQFSQTVAEQVKEKTSALKSEHDNAIDALGKQLQTAEAKAADLQAQLDKAAAATAPSAKK